MQPHYVTIPSSFPNSSPWQVIDAIRDPPSLTIAMQSSGGNWQVDVAVDDPTAINLNPTLNSSVAHQAGQSFPANVITFPSTAFATAQHLMVRSRRQAAVPTAPPQEATPSPESTSWYSRCRALEIGWVVNIRLNMLGRQRNARLAWQKPRAPRSLDRVVAMQ
jgi:hypothetical protein